jgi:tRNA pseudouridine38-40 synthase
VPFEIPFRGLILGMNNMLPTDIRIAAVEEVAPGFHARFDATRKTYQYCIWNDEVADVFSADTHAHVGQPLDAALMHEAAAALVGRHDFRAFTVAEPEVQTTTRTMEAVSVERNGHAIVITATADGFLRYQVRRIAGTLIEVGRRKIDAGAMRRGLEPTFEPGRWTAPAKGLTLASVEY